MNGTSPGPRLGPTAVRPRREAGQALVEFSMVIIVFGIAFFGFVDGVRLVYLNSTLSQAAREGARLASVEASWVGSTDATCGTTGGPICPATLDALKAQVVTAANRMITPFATIGTTDVTLSCANTTAPVGPVACDHTTRAATVSVRVTSTFTALTPVLGQILGSVQLSGSTTMAID